MREEAEKLLQPIADGRFLVRESTNYPGDYTLCVALVCINKTKQSDNLLVFIYLFC